MFLKYLLKLFQVPRSADPRSAMAITVEPLTAQQIEPAVQRAMNSLGLIKPEFIKAVTEIATRSQFGRSDLASMEVRKRSPQISKEAKKTLGLRANTFFSQDALDMLSDKGRGRPLWALEATLRRALFSRTFARDAVRAKGIGCSHYIWRCVGDESSCKECKKRNRKKFRYENAVEGMAPGDLDACTDYACRCYAEPIIPNF